MACSQNGNGLDPLVKPFLKIRTGRLRFDFDEIVAWTKRCAREAE